MSDAAPSVMHSKSLIDFGWDCEPAEGGGVRMCRSAGWRGTRLGCTFGFLVLLSPVLLALLFAGKEFWKGPVDEGALRIIFLLIPMGFVGFIGLVVAVIVVQILQLALLREEWLVSDNLLEVRRRLLGFAWSRHLHHGELVVEPQYGPDRHDPDWDLVVKCDGEKHFLLREWLIGVGGGRMSGSASRDEATAVADALAWHTGWNVNSVAAETGPAVAGDEKQHLTALRARGFVADVDEQLRLTIRPPKLGQLIAAVVLLAIGGGWLWLMAGAVNSFVNDAQAKQQPVLDIWFWLIMTPMLMAGVGLCTLGVIAFFGRERWTVDRNLLLVRTRLFGWKSEHEFVDARWKLTRVCHASSESTTWKWHLQLENQSGRTLKVLRMDRDDDLPRLLGTLLSQRTGWPLRDTEQ